MAQKKWDLQDIKPADAPSRSSARTTARKSATTTKSKKSPVQTKRTSKKKGSKKPFATIITIAVVLIFAFLISMFLGGFEVAVNPKTKSVSVQSDFTAYTEPSADQLGYELLTLEAEAEKEVEATGKEEVATHATGNLTIYSEETTSQRFITNTRFETSDGLIFKAKESIEIPAATEDTEGNLVPGTVTAEVYADDTGEAYNIAPTTFTVPGLEGSDQYETIYAESSTAFTGGFEGERYIVEETELETARQELHVELRNTLLQRLSEERPAGFVVYDSAVTMTFESLPATEGVDSKAVIKEKGYLRVPLFVESEFASHIASLTLPDYEDKEVYLEDPYVLSFTYTDATQVDSDISGVNLLDFSLSGTGNLIWDIDTEALAEKLAGLSEEEAYEVFAEDSSIGVAKIYIRPFWRSTLPEKADDIAITVSVEE